MQGISYLRNALWYHAVPGMMDTFALAAGYSSNGGQPPPFP